MVRLVGNGFGSVITFFKKNKKQSLWAGFEWDRPFLSQGGSVSRSAPFVGNNAACSLRRQLIARKRGTARRRVARQFRQCRTAWNGPVAHEHFQPSVRLYQDLSCVFEICVMFAVGHFVSGTNLKFLLALRRRDVAAQSTILKP